MDRPPSRTFAIVSPPRYVGAMKILIAIALLSVVAVLGLGLYSMSRGGEFNRKYGNRLMRLRVALQAVAIGLILIFVLMSGR